LPLSDEQRADALGVALRALDVDRLVLAIHDQSFPSTPAEDLGRGSPYGDGARALLRLIASLGFDGVQLGPQGDTSLANPSPYDGAQLTRSPLSLALATLTEDPAWAPLGQGLLAPAVAARPPGPPDRVHYRHAWAATRQLLAALHDRFSAAPALLQQRFAAFRARRARDLAPDGTFEALAARHGGDDWRRWPEPDRRFGGNQVDPRAVERHLFGQFVLAEQHAALRAAAAGHGILLYGDLQIGYSQRDLWSRRALFRNDYLMGAPPSRTNPAGQAWGYPVLDPAHYRSPDGSPGPGEALVTVRIDAMLADFDGVRIDHPHGLVDPWVYAAADPDPAAAVGRGARLFSSPDLPDHPALAPLAIARPTQLAADPGVPRYADDWVRALDDDQVTRYAVLFDLVMRRVTAAGRRPGDVVCEVLSTWPFPLRAVMARHGLGRFCVTQKADLARPDDVYRSENAGPRDWIMIGNHDTPPIWLLADRWQDTGAGQERALHLARRLMPDPALRPRLARWIAAAPGHLCQAMLAELFVSRARQVSVFFADLFGLREIYNRPGVVDDANWTLRLAPDFEARYRERVARGAALNVPLAVALALRAHDGDHPLLPSMREAALHLAPNLDEEIRALLGGADARRSTPP
jgi:4-alpha-glucanotransferase